MLTETCGSSSNESEKDDKSKMSSGSKDLCGVSARNRNDEQAINTDVTFIVLQKNMRSMHSSERIEEMVCELEGYRWDALLLRRVTQVFQSSFQQEF